MRLAFLTETNESYAKNITEDAWHMLYGQYDYDQDALWKQGLYQRYKTEGFHHPNTKFLMVDRLKLTKEIMMAGMVWLSYHCSRLD